MSLGWTTPSDIRERVRRRWDDGSLARAFVTDTPFPTIEIPLRGPRAGEIGDDLAVVRAWVTTLETGRRHDAAYALRYTTVGGRVIGYNRLPDRAIVSSYDQAWTLLGLADQVMSLTRIITAVSSEPAARSWVAAHPLQALQLAEDWPTLLAAHRWLDAARGSGQYLREITAPGVDTKFVERHRKVLAQLLDAPTSATGFLDALGLSTKPPRVRLRAAPELGLTGALSDVTARLDELASARPHVRSALIVENEITFLTVPVPDRGIILWGKGFEVSHTGSLPWLADVDVHYWGDLDTHGFAILDQLRATLPRARSLLMDRDTLLAHRDRWVNEPTPTTVRLDRLTGDEQALYHDLVTDRFGARIRLEQERIDWGWASCRFAAERGNVSDQATADDTALQGAER